MENKPGLNSPKENNEFQKKNYDIKENISDLNPVDNISYPKKE